MSWTMSWLNPESSLSPQRTFHLRWSRHLRALLSVVGGVRLEVWGVVLVVCMCVGVGRVVLCRCVCVCVTLRVEYVFTYSWDAATRI